MPGNEPKARHDAQAIQNWLIVHLAQLLKCPQGDIGSSASFDRLGLDSATAVGVTLDLEDWLGYTVDPAVFYDYPTIQHLAEHLAQTESATH